MKTEISNTCVVAATGPMNGTPLSALSTPSHLPIMSDRGAARLICLRYYPRGLGYYESASKSSPRGYNK